MINILKKMAVSILRGTLFMLTLVIFLLLFRDKYYGLNHLTRTLIIVVSSYLVVLILMGHVYENFDIGLRKSKPVLFSTFVNVFVADVITFIALRVMGTHDVRGLLESMITLLLVFFIQFFVIYLFTYFGNYIYFKMYDPQHVVVLHNGYPDLLKITNYFETHKKQYKITEVIQADTVSDLNYAKIDLLVVLGLDYEQVQMACMHSVMSNTSVMYNADLMSTIMGSKTTMIIGDVLMYENVARTMGIMQSFLKRAIDISISLVALALTFPLFIIIGILIKAGDGGSVFFLQNRITKDGKTFKIYKFRTMRMDADDQPALENDERVTSVGKFLRRFRIDELPQFINILFGDMSVVGPRPESESINHIILKEFPEFALRLKVKAGLTGYAQIFGKYNTTPKGKLILDLEYIQNFSIINDIRLILQTFIVFVKKDSTEGFANEDTIH